MRIHARPAVINFQTGQVSLYLVSVVGIAPHKTWYTEHVIGMVASPDAAPASVGKFIDNELRHQTYLAVAAQYGEPQAKLLSQQNLLPYKVPLIPGVTAPGVWKNPRYGNREGHRQKYSLKSRTPQTEREVIGHPERFHA